MTDIEIARNTKLEKIEKIAKKLNIKEEDIECYGKYKAKISNSVYEKLKDFNFFRTVSIDRGLLVWNNGEIDIAPETLYRDGFAYEVA